ncbi:MAG: uroporphyrinogen-III synthase [Rhodospirillales bacterium]
MTRRVLITRPQDDAAPLAERLAALGFESLIDPLLVIEITEGPALDLDGVQAILMTSANGARALARRTRDRTLPVFAVGDASAEISRALGFERVESAGGDVAALAERVKQRLSPRNGALVHVKGTRVAGDLAGDLESAGFSVRREVLYAAHPADRLSAHTIESLKVGRLDAVLLYSPRTAATFTALVQAAGLGESCKPMTAFCLSLAVAEAAAEVPFMDMRVASVPNQDALLEAIERWKFEQNGDPA